MRFCGYCGAELKDDDSFCGACGKKVEEKDESENKDKYLKAKEQYKEIYKYIKHTKINWKQRLRLILLRYFPKVHCKIY